MGTEHLMAPESLETFLLNGPYVTSLLLTKKTKPLTLNHTDHS